MFKLNHKGFGHHFLALLFVVIIAIVGIGYLIISHADVPYQSQDEFAKFVYGDNAGYSGSPSSTPIVFSNSGNLTLKFPQGSGNNGIPYSADNVAWYKFELPANTTGNSITATVTYLTNGYNTVFASTGSTASTDWIWSDANASSTTSPLQPVTKTLPTLTLANKPTVIYFGITAKGSKGTYSGSFPGDRYFIVNHYTLNGTTVSAAPTVSLTASPTSINSGDSSTLTWSSTNATGCAGGGAWSSNLAASGTQSVTPTATSTYTITCTGTDGSTANASATVTVNAPVSTGGGDTSTHPTCTKNLPSGSNVQNAMDNASPGDVICLAPNGTFTSPSLSKKSGTATSQIILTSQDWSQPALLKGRFVTMNKVQYLEFTHLKFLWTSNNLSDTVVLGSPHVSFTYNDVNGAKSTICLNLVTYSGSSATDNFVDHNTIHDCGSNTTDSKYHSQGIYVIDSQGSVISNNWCWNVSARCFQLRGAKSTTWHNNVSNDSREGFIFGGDISTDPSNLNAAVTNNNVYNNIVGSLSYNGWSGNSAYSYKVIASRDIGNNFHDNCVWKSDGPWSKDSSGQPIVAHSNNTQAHVSFVDVANHNFNLTASSACQAYAVQGGNPGP